MDNACNLRHLVAHVKLFLWFFNLQPTNSQRFTHTQHLEAAAAAVTPETQVVTGKNIKNESIPENLKKKVDSELPGLIENYKNLNEQQHLN